jgi:hypothetical protein
LTGSPTGAPLRTLRARWACPRATAYKWWHRYVQEGEAGLHDRSSRALRSPRRTSARVERQIEVLRRRTKLGPIRIGVRLHMPASTVHRVLVRQQLNRLSWMDRPTGRVIRRYEHEHPGDLVHVDVKKLGRIPPGGGWRVHGRLGHDHTGVGYDYVHSAVDDHSRLTYSEICSDERGPTAAAFWTRAIAFFAAHGIVVQRVLTDNAWAYRKSNPFRDAVRDSGAVQRYIRAAPTPDQRQGGAIQPHAARGMGLRSPLRLKPATPQGLDGLAAHLQPSPRPHQSRSAPARLTLNNVSGHYT